MRHFTADMAQDTAVKNPNTWLRALDTYTDKRIVCIFLNGIASGFPWVVIGSSMTLWLKDLGLTRAAIGFFGSIFVAYTLNFVWSPLVDAYRVPLLSRLGRRRSWMALAQGVLCVAIVGIALTNPESSLVWTSLLALVVAIAGATQDIAIDAYRIDVLSDTDSRLQAAGAAVATSGWWTGYSLMGAVALFVVDDGGLGWPNTFLLLAAFAACTLVVTVFICQSPAENSRKDLIPQTVGAQGATWRLVLGHLEQVVVAPLKDFFNRYHKLAVAILLFIFLFKIGEAFLGRMSLVFYSEIGFDKSEIAVYSKLVTWWVTIIFSVVSGAFIMRFGIIKGLMIGGISMAATNLLFAMMAIVGHQQWAFALTVVLDGFTSSFSAVAFVAFISYLTSTAFSATQYALMASLGNLGRTLVASSSGSLVDWLERIAESTAIADSWVLSLAASIIRGVGGQWSLFFILTALMVVPSLLLLAYCAKKMQLWQVASHQIQHPKQ